MDKVVVIGAGGFGREVLWLLEDVNRTPARRVLESGIRSPKSGFSAAEQALRDGEQFEVVGFVDEDQAKWSTDVCGLPVLGGIDWLKKHSGRVKAVWGIGSPKARKAALEELGPAGVEILSVVHPSVRCSRHVELGVGAVLCAGSIITTQVRIGRHVLVNLASTIGHDVAIGDFSTIAPGCNISGYVELGEGVELGTGVKVVPGRKIGDWAVVGAGAVVAQDIPAHVTVVGVPARPLPSRTSNHE